MRRLNVGAGPDRAVGWETLDVMAYEAPPTYLHDLRLPVERDLAGRFDSIVASHFLQQITYHEIGQVLRNLLFMLKHGGWLRVIMPDLLKAIGAWQEGNDAHFLVDDATEPTFDGKFCAYVTWYSTARTVWTQTAFMDTLNRAGFPVVYGVEPGQTRGYDPEIVRWDRREHESFFVEAVRP